MKNYYTFENFIIDEGNRFAYLMAKEILEEKTHRNNILFIYGDTGVGKTHLLKAILDKANKEKSSTKILYILLLIMSIKPLKLAFFGNLCYN